LDEISYSQVLQIIDEVSAAYDEMLVSLENGSMDALSKFLKKADKILEPMTKIVGKSLVSRTALILAPTIASKLAIAGLAGLSIYDILNGGEFLPELSSKLFKNVDGNIYSAIQEKESIDWRNPNNNEQDVSMIPNGEEVDTGLHYDQINDMTQEGNGINQTVDGVKYRVGDANARASNFLSELKDDPVNAIKEVPRSIKNFWQKIADRFENLSGDFELPVPDNPLEAFQSTTYADREAISEYIKNLSDDELLNLAYYYNHSANVDTNSVTYEAIGEILTQNNNLLRIDNAIKAYNEKMKMIHTVDEVIKDSGVIFPVITDVDEQVKKNIN